MESGYDTKEEVEELCQTRKKKEMEWRRDKLTETNLEVVMRLKEINVVHSEAEHN